MHKFDKEFEPFFGNPAIKELLAKHGQDSDVLTSLKNEEERLCDREKLEQFKLAVAENPHLFARKNVLTMRSGLGLVAIWVARLDPPPAKVYCLDDSNSIEMTRKLVKDLGLGHIIECIKAKASEVSLPEKSIDVIIGEWFGYFGINQSYIYDLIELRDRLLKSDGVVLPNKVNFYMAGFTDKDRVARKFEFWDNVYSFAMPSMKQICQGEAGFDKVDPKILVTQFQHLHSIDLSRARVKDTAFVAQFELEPKFKNAHVNGVVLWFDVVFSKCHIPIVINTSPYKNKTDICNCLLYFKKPFVVPDKRSVWGSFAFKNNDDDVSISNVRLSVHVDKTDVNFNQFYLLH